MDMFGLDDELTRLETALITDTGAARLSDLVALAWYLRQRDTARALKLADQAQACVQTASQGEANWFLGRLLLVRAEAEWLYSRLDKAQTLAREAEWHFHSTGHDIDMADTYFIMAGIASDRGMLMLHDEQLAQAVLFARQSQDKVRLDVIEARLAFMMALRDCPQALARWGQRFHAEMQDLHPAAEACVFDFLGMVATLSSDYGKAAAHFARSHAAAQKSGQVRCAIIAAINTGDAFAGLNDHHTALTWMQYGLDQARLTGWEACVGLCLMQTAETLRRLGRLDAAHELLQETLRIMAPVADSRNYAVALSYAADLALDRGQYPKALADFQQLAQRAISLQQLDIQMDTYRGQAEALLELGEVTAAFQSAHRALALAVQQHDASRQVSCLIVLSHIYERSDRSALPEIDAPNPVLHYLLQALEVTNTIAGYTVSGELLDAIARQYAALGDYTQAYKISMRAIASREVTHGQRATSRAIAMQVQHQTGQAQAQREHHRQLALSEARRVQVLHQNSVTLERLGAIGQEITAQLNTRAVVAALNQHVHGLLDANSFAIYFLDADGLHLNWGFGIEGDRILDGEPIEVSDAISTTARCARERREILRSYPGSELDMYLMPGTHMNASALFAPLMIGERVLGVMTIQSPRPQAYEERARLIFRTLCAYGAIALDNASAYQQLQDTQAQLVVQEKLAALGSLVAGVAHELNTPIGNSLMMASALQEKVDGIDQKLQSHTLLHSELCVFFTEAQEASAVIMRGLTSAAELVNSFKQVAMDRTTAHRRRFDLHQTSKAILATVMSQIRLAGHTFELDIPDHIIMEGYPGPYGQVIINLINNALLHAFEGRKGGKMQLSARCEGVDWVKIRFEDNGVGISEQYLSQIFDPFFTTKMGQGGSGLGLYMSYKIVTSLLNGRIDVCSQATEGACFTLSLPLVAPDMTDAASIK